MGLRGEEGYSHYAAAKFGVVGFMKSIALELVHYGIRANTIHPGAVLTGMTNHQLSYDRIAGREGGTYEEYVEGCKRYGILKDSGWLDPEVLANAALLLNSSLASNITGISLPVDSGPLALPGINLNPTW
jgi:NAD(P)-dependent dehydrogenase (short-subunit alcohol dehydrogenase family)